MAKKILIADDEELVRASLSRYIQNHCPFFEEILQADNGGTAVEMILANTPDVIILDVQMPVLTGIDVMRKIEESGLNPIVIILSGYNEFKYAQQAMHYGAKEYLMKPVKATDLVAVINNLVGEKTSSESPAEQTEAPVTTISRSAAKYIEDHYTEELSLTLVAEKLGLSAGYLSSKFSQEMNMGFVDYVNKVRIDHACTWLKQGYYKVYEISEKVGFYDTKYFTKIFKKVTGTTPKKFMQSVGNEQYV